MAWIWQFEKTDGSNVGASQSFESRSDAESWVGEAFEDLIDDGVDQVRLFEDAREAYGPMGLRPE
ncbi:MAG: hypothetical protein JJE02_07425 [Propionibacteriales bacterium]|nr:hypothetical protein [Propionibacteriales bacterium]